MTFFHRSRINRRRRSLTLGLEPLEGRRLLATIATAVDFNDNPVIFTLGSDGTVFVNQQRPTGDLSHPFASAGLVAIPGLKATSITATQNVFGYPEVDALVGSGSFVYRSVYGQPGFDFARGGGDVWSSWTQVGGDFVAKSIQAVSSGVGRGTIFAIGGDSNVYEDLSTSNGSTGFQVIPGLSATSISAVDLFGSGHYRIFAMTGPTSSVYQRDVGGIDDPTLPDTTNAWNLIDPNFVATSIVATADPLQGSGYGDNPFGPLAFAGGVSFSTSVLAVGFNGGIYRSYQDTSLTPNSLPPTSFAVLGTNPGGGLPSPVSSVVAQVDASGSVATFFAQGTNGVVYTNQARAGQTQPNDLETKNWVALGGQGNTEIAGAVGRGIAAQFVGRASSGFTSYQIAPELPSSAAGINFAFEPVQRHPLDLYTAVHPPRRDLGASSGSRSWRRSATTGRFTSTRTTLSPTASS